MCQPDLPFGTPYSTNSTEHIDVPRISTTLVFRDMDSPHFRGTHVAKNEHAPHLLVQAYTYSQRSLSIAPFIWYLLSLSVRSCNGSSNWLRACEDIRVARSHVLPRTVCILGVTLTKTASSHAPPSLLGQHGWTSIHPCSTVC